MNITIIANPADIKRNADGTWRHPDIPTFFPNNENGFEAWAKRQHFTIHTVQERLRGEAFTDWTPDAPEGDEWFTLEVKMVGRTAFWTWARRNAP